jgi:hypothetical protein
MGLLDFLRTSPSYNANRVFVRRWLLRVQFPDLDELEELPFADLDIDYDLREPSDPDDDEDGDEEAVVSNPPPQIFPGLDSRRMSGQFDYSQATIQFSPWDNPFEFTSTQPLYNATYDANPAKIQADGSYSRVLPFVQTSVFHIPGIEEESPSEEESSDEEG